MLVVLSKIQNKTKIYQIDNITPTNHDHNKYINTQEFNKLISENFTAISGQANLAGKNYIAALVKEADFGEQLKKKK